MNENTVKPPQTEAQSDRATACCSPVVEITVKEYESLKRDKVRLDFLERAHDALNSRHKTNYGWELVINSNVVRAMVKNAHPWDGKDGIDLYDSKGGYDKSKTCREAIDKLL